MTITTLRVTDKLRVACLRVALQNKQVVDVVNEDGDTVRGRVLAIDPVDSKERWDTNAQWIVVVEVASP